MHLLWLEREQLAQEAFRAKIEKAERDRLQKEEDEVS